MSHRATSMRGFPLAVALLLPLAFSAAAVAQSGVASSPRAAAVDDPATCQYRPVRHETIDGIGVSVVERVAPLPDADDQRVVVWIDDGEHRIWKIELHDNSGRLLYTVRYLRYERHGDHWIPMVIYVLDQSHGETRVVRELHELAGIDLDQVHVAAVGCASLN